MKVTSTAKQKRTGNHSKECNAARKVRKTCELLERALSMASAADVELKALFRGINDELGQMDITYPNY